MPDAKGVIEVQAMPRHDPTGSLLLLCLLGTVGTAPVRGLHPKVDLRVESLWQGAARISLEPLSQRHPGACLGGRPQSELVSGLQDYNGRA
jgi:hypothetical protein